MGFLAFGLYLLAGLLCFGAAIMARHQFRRASMWFLTGAFLTGMGINKQFDLHNLISEFGRIVATNQGWYDARRDVQRTVMIVLIVAGLVVLLFLIGLYWRLLIEHQVLLLGLFVLVGVIVFQASAFHHFNPLGFLVEYTLFDVIELIGLLLINLDVGVFFRELWRGDSFDDDRFYYDDEDDIESTMIMPSPYPDQRPSY